MPLTGERKREYKREWMRKRRQAWIDSQGGCCAECGSTDQLEVDHIDPSLKVTHKVWSWSAERREAELAKCQVLCYDCHLAKTIKYVSVELPHGTYSGFQYHNCRCDPCRVAYRKRWREYRARTKPRSVLAAR